jgi:complex iron-sulfur molybdoenzyme family reductase subunit alpha
MQFYIDHEWYLELDEHLPTHGVSESGRGLSAESHRRHALEHAQRLGDDAILLNLQRGEPLAFISMEDAKSRGIGDGEFVELYNDVASFRVRWRYRVRLGRGR